jgi:two-component system, NtrC family, nitrogen regulation response regulator NtrX
MHELESSQALKRFFAGYMQSHFSASLILQARINPERNQEDADVEVLFGDHTYLEQDALLDYLRDAIASNTSSIVQQSSRAADFIDFQPFITSPLSMADHVIGAFGVMLGKRFEADTEVELQFLMAATQTYTSCLLAKERLELAERELARSNTTFGKQTRIIGSSRSITKLRGAMRQAAKTTSSILIVGETGTGKELAAKYIHEHSMLHESPYIVINCAAIPNELMQSELFGHEQGAFSGATNRHIGLLEKANGGTLFFDEVGDLSLTNQARLLRVLENGSFRRVGGTEELFTDVRIVSATNCNLTEMIDSGLFREDLYHRIAGFKFVIPPLRQRRSDIPKLVEHYFRQSLRKANRNLQGVSEDTLEYLCGARWPGNVRQLKNTVERGVALAVGTHLEQKDVTGGSSHSNDGPNGLISLEDLERQHVIKVLAHYENNIKMSAPVLGIAASTLYKKIKKFGISLE